MTEALPPASFQSCPSCGSALNRGALTCGYCGGVVAIESVSCRLKSEFRSLVSKTAASLQDRTALMWVLAVVPILILPPALALVMNLRRKDSGTGAPQHPMHFAIIVVAICNIVLSFLFWRWLSEVSMSSGLLMDPFFKSLGISRPGSPLQSI